MSCVTDSKLLRPMTLTNAGIHRHCVKGRGYHLAMHSR